MGVGDKGTEVLAAGVLRGWWGEASGDREVGRDEGSQAGLCRRGFGLGSRLICRETLGTPPSFSGCSLACVRNEWRETDSTQVLLWPLELRLLGEAPSQPRGARGDGAERPARRARPQGRRPTSDGYGRGHAHRASSYGTWNRWFHDIRFPGLGPEKGSDPW